MGDKFGINDLKVSDNDVVLQFNEKECLYIK